MAHDLSQQALIQAARMNLEQGLAIYGAGLATLLAILRGLDRLAARRELPAVDGSVTLVAMHRVEHATEPGQDDKEIESTVDFGWRMVAEVTNRGQRKIFLKSIEMRQESRSWRSEDWHLPSPLEPGESARFSENSATARGFRPDLPVKFVAETSKGRVVRKWEQGWAIRVTLRLFDLKTQITGKARPGRTGLDAGAYSVEYRLRE